MLRDFTWTENMRRQCQMNTLPTLNKWIEICRISCQVKSSCYHIETSPLICSVNQWTGFYMIGILVSVLVSVLKKISSIHRKAPVFMSLFNIIEGLIKMRLQHSCFSVNIKKFLRIPNLKSIYED